MKTGKVDVLTLSPIFLPDAGIENFTKLALEHNKNIRIIVQPIWLRWDIYEPTTKRPEKVDHNAITGKELRIRHAEHFKKMDAHIVELNQKMGEALNRLAKEDPSFRVSSDNESGQTIIKGMGELHLEIIVDRMKREFKVEANIGAPQVAYRETITSSSKLEYTHKKQSGGAGQFAKVKLAVEPLSQGEGRIVENLIKGGAIPREFIPGVEKGILSVADSGVLAGFPLLDYKVQILDGLHHEVDSSPLAFELAARYCFRELCLQAHPKLLEPIMKVEVVTPEDYMGDVIGDLNSRRGQVGSTDKRGNAAVINAMVPLANMFGYVNTLRSMSQGRAQYTMQFDHYDRVPQNVQDEVTKKMA